MFILWENKKEIIIMGICEVLTVTFVVCKLLGVINWSWWLVVSPIYPALAGYIIMLIIGFLNLRG